jgi:membrane protease subunit HflK
VPCTDRLHGIVARQAQERRMAWNLPGKGSGSDKGSKDPWKGRDPDRETDAFLDRLKQGMGRMFGGEPGSSDNGPRFAIWFGVLVLAGLLFSSFQLINETQRGVVLRFGQFDRIMTPGVNLKWPWPIEVVTKVETTQVRSAGDLVRMLTHDQNIVQVDYNVQYTVSDPRLFLFGNRDPEKTLEQSAESVIREVIGASLMDDVIGQTAMDTVHLRDRLQASLDEYHTGLQVADFTIKKVGPPDEVKDAFDDVTRAQQDKDKVIQQAEAYESDIIPKARGQAASVRIGAEGYKAAVIAAVQGNSQRYALLADQYHKAPEVIRKRLYLETMEAVLANSPKVVAGRGNNTIYLPAEHDQADASATATQTAPVNLPAVTASMPAASDANSRPDRAPRPDGREEPRQ